MDLPDEYPIYSKLKKLLDLFLHPDYKVRDDVYISTLLTHVKSECNEGKNTNVLLADLFTEWILKTISSWSKNGVKADPHIPSFLINVLSELSQNVSFFINFQNNDTYNNLFTIIEIMDPHTPHTVRLAYVRLFRALLTHKEGILWINKNNFWNRILELNAMDVTIYLNRETQASIRDLLKRTVTDNTDFCKKVIAKIIDPLINHDQFPYSSKSSEFSEINQDEFYQTVKTKLNLINFILDDIACNIIEKQEIDLMKMFHEFPLKQSILNYINIINRTEFVYDLSKVLIMLELYNLSLPKDISNTTKSIFNILNENLSKKYFENVLKLSSTCFITSKKIFNKQSEEEKHKRSLFTNQFLAVTLLPTLKMSKIHYFPNIELLTEDKNSISTLNNILLIGDELEVKQFLIIWQSAIASQLAETQIAVRALSHLMASKKQFQDNDAKNICCCLTAIIKNVTDTLKMSTKDRMSANFLTFSIQALEASCTLYNDFIIFDDHCEILLFLEVVVLPLQFSISYCVTEKILKLINIILKKYLVGHDTILEERLVSLMKTIIPIICTKLSDDAWEVRDSTLEVFSLIIKLSDKKFPELQESIIEQKIPRYVLTKAVYDCESFTRTTGFQCLREMVKVTIFWIDLDKSRNLTNCLIQAFNKEDEGTVRKEILKTLCEIYKCHPICEENLEELHKVMFDAMYDFYWEVKIEALKFWEIIINQNIEQKELQHLVGLEESTEYIRNSSSEICEVVKSVFFKLNDIGCLKLLADAVQDDCDIEVSKYALKIVYVLKRLINSSRISPENIFLDKSRNDSHLMNSEQCSETSEIITESDFRGQHHSGELKNSDTISINNTKCMKPIDFVNFIQQDFRTAIEDRKKWLRGIDELDSLLDDMLMNYEDEFNTMDCY